MVEGVDDDGANRIQENDDNTFGCPGATGVARPRTEKNKPKNSTKDARTNFTEFRIVSTKLFLTT